MIRDKARAFAATTSPTPDSHIATSTNWIQKFKLKHNLMGARARKTSLALDDAEEDLTNRSATQTPTPTSPTAGNDLSPVDESEEMDQHEDSKDEDDFLDYTDRPPFHSQSTSGLNGVYIEHAVTSFSPTPVSPTSPFFAPESSTAPTHFTSTARPLAPAATSGNTQRPRSRTFPLLDQYALISSSGESLTPKYVTCTALDSPMEEDSMDPFEGVDDHPANTNIAAETRARGGIKLTTTMPPPTLPGYTTTTERKQSLASVTSTSSTSTSPEEARQAMRIVVNFFEQQPQGFLDLQESVTLGKLMEKIKLHV